MHNTLGVTGRTRCEEHGRYIAGLVLGHLFGKEAGVDTRKRLACRQQLVHCSQSGFVVVAHAARVIVEDVGQLRTLVTNFEQLVYLFLIFCKGKSNFGVIDGVDALRRSGILVQGNWYCTE